MEILDEGIHRERTGAEESERLLLKMEAEAALRHIRNGRYALFALAVLIIVAGIIAMAPTGNTFLEAEGDALIIGAALMGAVYLGLAIASLKYFMVPFGLAAGIYGLSILYEATQDPTSIARGIIIKIIVIYYLITALMASVKLKKTIESAAALGFSREALME
mgnify:FL=1